MPDSLWNSLLAQAKEPDVELRFSNTMEAGARMFLEAADAAREGSTKPPEERMAEFLRALARIHRFCSNTERVTSNLIEAITDMAGIVGVEINVDLTNVYEKDMGLLALKPTLFTINHEGEAEEDGDGH